MFRINLVMQCTLSYSSEGVKVLPLHLWHVRFCDQILSSWYDQRCPWLTRGLDILVYGHATVMTQLSRINIVSVVKKRWREEKKQSLLSYIGASSTFFRLHKNLLRQRIQPLLVYPWTVYHKASALYELSKLFCLSFKCKCSYKCSYIYYI